MPKVWGGCMGGTGGALRAGVALRAVRGAVHTTAVDV